VMSLSVGLGAGLCGGLAGLGGGAVRISLMVRFFRFIPSCHHRGNNEELLEEHAGR